MEKYTNNVEEVQQDNGATEQDGKQFTQSEVDEIVKNRLQRERKKLESEFESQKETQKTERESQLAAREIAVSCKEFLLANGYPLELLEVIGAADVSKFEKKVSQLDALLKPRQTAPMYNAEPVMDGRNAIRDAFSPDARHTPKHYEGNWF